MRFHIGFSKSIPIKWILIALGLVLAFFGLVPHAYADSFSVFQTWAWCPLNSQHYESTGCTAKGVNDTDQTSVNGLAHVRIPKASVLSSMGKNGKYSYSSHSEIFKWGGTGGCNTGSTIHFDVDIVLKDNQNIFSASSLDYNAWPGGSGGSPVLRATQSFSWHNYYSWLGNNTSFSNNQLGVAVTKNDYNYNFQQCSFVSYGSNKTVKFLCSIDSGNTGYYIRVNEPNYTGNNTGGFDSGVSSSSPVIITGVQVNMLNDPCKPYGMDQSGVVDAITDQTNDIMGGFNNIISNNNSNTNSINSHIDGVAEGIEGLNDSVDGVAEGIDGIKDSMNNSNTNAYVNGLGLQFSDHGVSSILQAPLRLYSGVMDAGYAWNGEVVDIGTRYMYSCNDLPINFSLFGHSVSASLPCGKVLWNQADLNFKTLWFIGVCGVFAWVGLMKLVRLVEDSLNPEYVEELSDDLSRL